MLVICPTRELATQAAAEANTLLKYHPSIGVQVVIGGTRLALEQKRMQANPCQVIISLRIHFKSKIKYLAEVVLGGVTITLYLFIIKFLLYKYIHGSCINEAIDL